MGKLVSTSGVPRPVVDPWQEAQNRATAMSRPYLDYLSQQQAQEAANARAAATQRKADLDASYALQTPIIDKNYGKAIAANAAIEDAVSKHLATSGAESAATLRSQLEQIGAKGTDADVAALEQMWKGAAGAEYATGTSDIQNLVSNQAAAHELLGKQQISDTTQIGRDLESGLSALAKEYGMAKADVLKSMPEQIQNLVAINRQDRQDEEAKREFDVDQSEKTRQYNKEYQYRNLQDIQERADARRKLALETKLTAQQTMDEQTYKVWAKKFDAHQKALDRQSRKEIAAAQRTASAQSKVSGIDLTGPSNRKYITVPDANGNPTLVENPNYVPPSKKTKSATSSSADTVDTAGSAKRNRAFEAARAAVFNTSTGRVRDTVAYAQDSNIKAMNLINAALKGQGVDPYSKAGSQIRQSLWAFLDGKPAGTGKTAGKFVDPRKDDPRFRSKKKRK